jgi:hypothetical protein
LRGLGPLGAHFPSRLFRARSRLAGGAEGYRGAVASLLTGGAGGGGLRIFPAMRAAQRLAYWAAALDTTLDTSATRANLRIRLRAAGRMLKSPEKLD